MESIPIENANLEDDEITPEEQAFNEEIKNMELELKRMDKQRKNYVDIIREKFRNYIKNGDAAIGYLPRYVKLSIDFVDYQFEKIDGEDTLSLWTDAANRNECYEIQKLANQLCGAYLEINVDIDDHGYIIYYSNKEGK